MTNGDKCEYARDGEEGLKCDKLEAAGTQKLEGHSRDTKIGGTQQGHNTGFAHIAVCVFAMLMLGERT